MYAPPPPPGAVNQAGDRGGDTVRRPRRCRSGAKVPPCVGGAWNPHPARGSAVAAAVATVRRAAGREGPPVASRPPPTPTLVPPLRLFSTSAAVPPAPSRRNAHLHRARAARAADDPAAAVSRGRGGCRRVPGGGTPADHTPAVGAAAAAGAAAPSGCARAAGAAAPAAGVKWGGGVGSGGLPTRNGQATYVEPAVVAAPGGHRGRGRRSRGGGQEAAGLGCFLFPSSSPDAHPGGAAVVGHSYRPRSPDRAGVPPLAAEAGLASGDDALNGTVSFRVRAVGVTCAQWRRFQRRSASTGRSLSRLRSSLCPTRVPSCPCCTSCVCWRAAPPQSGQRLDVRASVPRGEQRREADGSGNQPYQQPVHKIPTSSARCRAGWPVQREKNKAAGSLKKEAAHMNTAILRS